MQANIVSIAMDWFVHIVASLGLGAVVALAVMIAIFAFGKWETERDEDSQPSDGQAYGYLAIICGAGVFVIVSGAALIWS